MYFFTLGGLNCAYFIAGIVEEILFGCNFVSMKKCENIKDIDIIACIYSYIITCHGYNKRAVASGR